MKFKPLSKKYQFNDTLVMDFPSFMHQPIANWLEDLLTRKNLLVAPDMLYPGKRYITDAFREVLHVNLRESYPQAWGDFINHILTDTDRTLTILQWCLNYHANARDANNLEWLLSSSGSGYEVEKTDKEASEYKEGIYDLIERVSTATKEAAKHALSQNEQLLTAWRACYGRKPNYKEVVQESQNVLEELLRDRYLPKDKKAQLGKLIADIKAGKTLSYKGSDVPTNPNTLLELVDQFPAYRGMHTAGTGKNPTKQQAEYILHTTIYLWNLHQK